jgi:hypothetical protein
MHRFWAQIYLKDPHWARTLVDYSENVKYPEAVTNPTDIK